MSLVFRHVVGSRESLIVLLICIVSLPDATLLPGQEDHSCVKFSEKEGGLRQKCFPWKFVLENNYRLRKPRDFTRPPPLKISVLGEEKFFNTKLKKKFV